MSTEALEERVAALERELGRRRRGGRALHSLAAALVLSALAVPLALAGEAQPDDRATTAGNARGEPVQIAVRNRSRGETGLIADSGGYSLRLSNVNRGDGGGAIFGCRAAAGRESCVNADNLANGQAFFFRSREGSSAGHFQVDGPGAVPFTTNAAGLVANLNADKVDGLDADQLQGRQGPAGPRGERGEQGPQGPPGPTAGFTSGAVDPPATPDGLPFGSSTVTMETPGRLLVIGTIDLVRETCSSGNTGNCVFEWGLFVDGEPVAGSGRSNVVVNNGVAEESAMTLIGITGELPAGEHQIELLGDTTSSGGGVSRSTFSRRLTAVVLGGG